jgi:hypothetical protein
MSEKRGGKVRTINLAVGGSVAVAILMLWLAFGAKAQEPSITSSGTVATTSSGLATFNTGPHDEIVHCDKLEPSGKPYACHLVGKHTLDDVIQYIWGQNEDRRLIYREQAEELQKRLKKP